MRPFCILLALLAVLIADPVRAQEPPPRIPFFVVDVQGTIPRFPSDNQGLADSRGMALAELPGTGIGAQVAANIYPFKWKAVTFGFGGSLIASHASETPVAGLDGVRPSEERFRSYVPQFSLNFGTGYGWSYISGGVGQSTWALVPQGQEGFPPDSEPLKTINYGVGARWFMKQHLAFSFDVRFYVVDPSTPYEGFPASPRTRLTIFSAGISLK
jgi:hypothetical protein